MLCDVDMSEDQFKIVINLPGVDRDVIMALLMVINEYLEKELPEASANLESNDD